MEEKEDTPDAPDELTVIVEDKDGNKETISIPDFIVDFVEMIFGENSNVYTEEQRTAIVLLMVRLKRITESMEHLVAAADSACCEASHALLSETSVSSLAGTMRNLVTKDKIRLASGRPPGFPIIGPHGRAAENLATAVFLWIMARNEATAKDSELSYEKRRNHLNALGSEFIGALGQLADLHPAISFIQLLEVPAQSTREELLN